MRLFLTLIALASFALYWFHIRMKPEDITAYTQLIQESTELRTRHALQESPAHQSRQGVQKDIWTQDESRHYQIQSEHSYLTLSPKTAVEELKNIRCTLQNDFTLTADTGIYTYPTHQFTAQQNCHLLQGPNSIYGTRVQFDPTQEIVTCENPKGNLQDLNFTANQLIWNKKENKLYLDGQVKLLSSHMGELLPEGKKILRSGKERKVPFRDARDSSPERPVQNKESFALADTLIYDLLDKTIHLTAKRKVLFWQTDLSLSASEVLIRKDQSIQGLGDVHFSFDLDEQNIIDQFFKHYL